MTKKTNIKTFLIAAIAALGFTASASAQGASASAPVSTSIGTGLLGQSYVGMNYGYTVLHDSSVSDMQALNLEYNQPLNTGFDFNLGMGDGWSSRLAGTRTHLKDLDASAIAFLPDLSWGRPFIGVGAGWEWTKTGGTRDNSFLWSLDTGVEFQVTRELSLTPLVSFTDTTSIHRENKVAYGVKANYWITSQWAVSGAVMRDNMVNTTYSLGMNYRF